MWAPNDENFKPLHIPLCIELIDNKGAIVSLVSEKQPICDTLQVTAVEQSFVFDDVKHSPVPALLNNFSAPVKLNYAYTDAQLIHIISHSQND